MKISKLITKLEQIKDYYGDIEAQLHETKAGGETGELIGYESLFLVPEEYEYDDGTKETICNIRWWPY